MAASARKRDGKNVRASSTTEKLDEIFNNFVDSMKPFVLKLAKKSGNSFDCCFSSLSVGQMKLVKGI
jgi:hypothetical protein